MENGPEMSLNVPTFEMKLTENKKRLTKQIVLFRFTASSASQLYILKCSTQKNWQTMRMQFG